jgi:hypothetical protein
MSAAAKRELFVVVADLDTESAIGSLLLRGHSLGICRIGFDRGQDILRHPGRDAGCCEGCIEALRPALRTHVHALALFDREGSGREADSREVIERDLEQRLSRTGWGDCARVVVLDPELESWVWASSPHVAAELGWPTPRSLRRFLRSGGWLPRPDDSKPPRPKEALEAALVAAGIRRSPYLFRALAEKVGRLGDCTDPAFMKFLGVLRAWFPPARELHA